MNATLVFSRNLNINITQTFITTTYKFIYTFILLQDNRKVTGKCGGYCGTCSPEFGLKLDILPPQPQDSTDEWNPPGHAAQASTDLNLRLMLGEMSKTTPPMSRVRMQPQTVRPSHVLTTSNLLQRGHERYCVTTAVLYICIVPSDVFIQCEQYRMM